MIKIVYISNFLEHHTLPLIQSFLKMDDVEFKYIALSETPKERIKLGYDDMNETYDFVIKAYKTKRDKKESFKVLKNSSLAIFGGVWGKYAKICTKNKIPSLRISERFLKGDLSFIKKIAKIIKYKLLTFREKDFLLLCCGHYAFQDFTHTAYKKRCLKFGYFPKLELVDLNCINKEKNSIVWAGRFLDWKHPEYIVKIAKTLASKNIDFKINVVGDGPMFEEIFTHVKENLLISDKVVFYGSQNHKTVRDIMMKSEIHILTSDSNEGWGAVLNESMNSLCIPIVNRGVGSSTYLIDDGVNGFLYDNYDEFEKAVINVLMMSASSKHNIAKKAYYKLFDEWNSDVCSNRIIKLFREHDNGSFKTFDLFESGPLSIEKYENRNN